MPSDRGTPIRVSASTRLARPLARHQRRATARGWLGAGRSSARQSTHLLRRSPRRLPTSLDAKPDASTPSSAVARAARAPSTPASLEPLASPANTSTRPTCAVPRCTGSATRRRMRCDLTSAETTWSRRPVRRELRTFASTHRQHRRDEVSASARPVREIRRTPGKHLATAPPSQSRSIPRRTDGDSGSLSAIARSSTWRTELPTVRRGAALGITGRSVGGRHHAGDRVADEAGLLVALDLEGEAGDDLVPAAALLVDRDDLGLGADLGVDGTGAGKRILFQP